MDPLDPADARRRKRLTAAILLVGFGAAIVVYFIASARPENPLGYEPLETKKYLHDLELYGGKANVLAAELREWFASLWYGKTLAATIAVITVLLAAAVRFVYAMRATPLDDLADPPPPPRLLAIVRPSTPPAAGKSPERGDGPSGWGDF